jgi:predicted  nucleic acid-binding Zn-ribbon protein
MTNLNEIDTEDWKDKYRALEKEYDDFREQSQSLERELEMDVELLEKNNKELKSKNNQIQFDLETLRVCLLKSVTQLHRESPGAVNKQGSSTNIILI